MKTIFTLLLAVGLLGSAAAMPGQPDSASITLTKNAAKELGLNKEKQAKVDMLNQERTRDLRIVNIVYKHHPIMHEAKTKTINEAYKQKLQQLLNPIQYQAFLAIK